MINWNKTLVRKHQTICETILCIDQAVMQVALVVDADGKLLGAVTDGDVRRGLLKGIRLDEAVHNIMNKTPFYVSQGYDLQDVIKIMAARKIHQVPVVDDEHRVVDLIVLDELIRPMTKRDNWVVLMAGGLGTRLRPLTDTTPKPLISVGGKPLLESILENFIAQGFRRFYISVNYKRELIQEHFADGAKWGVEIRYLNEDTSLGTAGALSLIEELPQEPLVVMNGDLMTDVDFGKLLDFHADQTTLATMGVREYDIQVPFGVVSIQDETITAINEKPVHRVLVNGGIYVLNPDVLAFIEKDKALDMPVLFEKLIAEKHKCSAFPIHEYWLDIGRIEDLQRAREKASV